MSISPPASRLFTTSAPPRVDSSQAGGEHHEHQRARVWTHEHQQPHMLTLPRPEASIMSISPPASPHVSTLPRPEASIPLASRLFTSIMSISSPWCRLFPGPRGEHHEHQPARVSTVHKHHEHQHPHVSTLPRPEASIMSISPPASRLFTSIMNISTPTRRLFPGWRRAS